MWASGGRQGQAEHTVAAEARVALQTSPEGWTQVGQLPFFATVTRASSALAKVMGGPGRGRFRRGGSQGCGCTWGLAPLCQRQDIFLSICGTLLRDNVRVFLHTCSCFCFSVLKSVCVLTCPLQYPYRYICCVPYEMLGSGKSNQPTHRLLTVSTSAFD